MSDLKAEKSNSQFSRRKVRSLIFHVLYALEAYDYQVSVEAIIDMLNRGYETDIPSDSEIITTSKTIVENNNLLDEKIQSYIKGWKLDRVSLCTKLILRMALWEMHNTYTPGHIVINEAVELSQGFCEKDAYKFVNGVLDKAFKQKEASVLE